MKTLEGKVVALGSQGVGKTSMIIRYTSRTFNEHVSPTIGASFSTCKFDIENARIVLQVWDTAGQEKFKSMAPMYYRNANAAMLVFDLTQYNTFAAMKGWVAELRRKVEETMVLVLVGNKSDLRKERQVDAEEGRVYATKIGATYHETSVVENEGIENVFFTIDCYGRVSIGSKLPDMDNVLRVDAVSLAECKESCTNDRNGCDAFSFGVGLKGNSTCLISPRVPILEKLEIDPEYDVYVRKRHDALWCDFDRLYYRSLSGRSGNDSGSRSSTDIKRINKKGRVSTTGNLLSKLIQTSMPALIPLGASPFSRNEEDVEDDGLVELVYNSFIDHEKCFYSDDKNRRILDIVANKHDRTVSASPLVAICHRKLLPGKKMMELLVERVVSCENVQDCCRACDYEKTFVCKGFNHRRRTDDSKCMCELTSTPHIRMDVDEDFSVDSHYDYYEKNENCLPPILYGSSLSPPLKNRIKNYEASDRSTYDEIYSPSSESTLGYPKPILTQSNEQLNYEELRGGFASHQNAALNWNQKWKNADAINGNTFFNSPLNYDKEYLDVKPSIFSKSPIKQNRPSKHGFSSSDVLHHPDFYRKFYNYSDAFGYDANSYVPVARASFQSPFEKYEKFQMSRRCSMKAVSGTKLSRSILRKTCLSHDLDQCEDVCINEMSFSCQSFAYRYNVLTANPTDNCLLSDISYRDLNFYTDLEPDRDYDSYVLLMPDSKICDLKKSANRYPSEECFTRIKSGFAMPKDITKKSVFANDLGECQFACTASQQFTCRSFVFKYAGKNHGRDYEHVPFNCFLSDWPSEEMNPTNMPDMDGAELYERNTFPYGCETYPFTSLSFSHVTIPNGKRVSQTHATDELCYSEHHRSCKLMSHAVVSSMRSLTKSECRQKCSTMRNTAMIPCMSFNYLINTDGTQDNCFLSDIPRRDLRPNLDYVRDKDHILYTLKEFEPLCGVTPAFEKSLWSLSPPLLSPTLSDPNTQIGSDIYRPMFHSFSTAQWIKKFQPDNYERNYNHELPNGDDKSTSNSGSSERQSNFLYSSQLSPFRRYTVNGDPCRNGTVCQRNEIAGFWSCETENEHGDHWDYCCEPSHQCGFSQGYHYPWCYVGSNQEQWRPCSETYNPYYSSKDHSIYRQSPLYTARHWPVIYFHETSPPNCSINDP